jgi:hypothetical protein
MAAAPVTRLGGGSVPTARCCCPSARPPACSPAPPPRRRIPGHLSTHSPSGGSWIHHRPGAAAIGGTLGEEEEDEEGSGAAPSPPATSTSTTTNAAAMAAAAAADAGALYPAAATARLVDVAMLASLGGLAFALGAVLRLQAYLSYLLPLPVAVAAGRWGPAAGVRAASGTALLALGEWCGEERGS